MRGRSLSDVACDEGPHLFVTHAARELHQFPVDVERLLSPLAVLQRPHELARVDPKQSDRLLDVLVADRLQRSHVRPRPALVERFGGRHQLRGGLGDPGLRDRRNRLGAGRRYFAVAGHGMALHLALLHAVAVVKAGAFDIVRVVYDVYGVEFAQRLNLLTPLVVAAAVTIISGSLRALFQCAGPAFPLAVATPAWPPVVPRQSPWQRGESPSAQYWKVAAESSRPPVRRRVDCA